MTIRRFGLGMVGVLVVGGSALVFLRPPQQQVAPPPPVELRPMGNLGTGQSRPQDEPQPLARGEQPLAETAALEEAVRRIIQWRDANLAAEFQRMRDAEKMLQNILPLMEVETLLGENKYPEALAKLRQRVVELEARLAKNDPRKPAFEDGVAFLQLGRLQSLIGEHDEARKQVLRGLDIQRRLSREAPEGGKEVLVQSELLAAGVLVRGHAPHEARDHVEAAQRLCQEFRQVIPGPVREHLELVCHLTLAEVQQATGAYASSLDEADKALAYLEARSSRQGNPEGHLLLAVALYLKAGALHQSGRGGEARPLLQEAVDMFGRHARAGHPLLGAAHTSLASLSLEQGDETKALEHLRQAREAYKVCFPKDRFPQGHPLLIQVRDIQGLLLLRLERFDEALRLHADNWEQCKKLYGRPHPDQLTTLMHYSHSARLAGKAPLARDLALQAVDLVEQIHALPPRAAEAEVQRRQRLASCRLLAALAQARLGQHEQAREAFAKTAELLRELYPKGHPERTAVDLYQAALALLRGKPDQAHPLFHQVLAAQEQEIQAFGAAMSAAEAQAFARRRQVCLSGLLTACQRLPATREDAYSQVWSSKSLLTRLLQERRRAILTAQAHSKEVKALSLQLLDKRTQIGRLVNDRSLAPGKRDAQLLALYKSAEDLERRRNSLLKAEGKSLGAERPEGEGPGPAELAKHLPEDVAFVDFVRYDDLADPAHAARYLAFLVTRGKKALWIELPGPARAIDEAVRGWRQAVKNWDPQSADDGRRDAERDARRHAATLRELVWAPIATHFPAQTRTVYLAVDGELACFPFVALPGSQADRILLEEDLLIGYVPHGLALLRQLLAPPPPLDERDPLLVLANVAYGTSGGLEDCFGPLDSGPAVIAGLRRLGGKRPITLLEKDEARRSRFQDELRKARVAYVATHGFFDQKAWEKEQKRWRDHVKNWSFQAGQPFEPVALGRRSPLSYTALALYGANQASVADGGLLTGDAIAELTLERLYLIILSACETGLGEYTAGEGVQGLLRAFHLTGAHNVVATLWSPYVEPADALLNEFCAQMWQKKKPPLEALRDAQREIYLHPERAPINGKTYGGADGSRVRQGSVKGQPPAPPLPGRQRASVKLWGAFVLSGVGR